MTEELLALVTPHGIDPLKVPGGVPVLTGMDVAGALAYGLSELGARLLLVKYADERPLIRDLRISWFMHVMERGKVPHGWKSNEPYRFRNMADTTLDEFLALNLCPRCKGRGETMTRKVPVQCGMCEGGGRRYPGERAMARGVGVSVQAYRETWATRVKWCRDELESVERVSVSLLRRGLRP